MKNGQGKNGERLSHTLLIIDDDAEWTDLLSLYFVGKYRVLVSNAPADALRILGTERPSLVILDLVMPSIDGFGIIRRLHDTSLPPIPTILLTGWNSHEIQECAASVGCAAVLSKPVSLTVLDRVVESVLQSQVA